MERHWVAYFPALYCTSLQLLHRNGGGWPLQVQFFNPKLTERHLSTEEREVVAALKRLMVFLGHHHPHTGRWHQLDLFAQNRQRIKPNLICHMALVEICPKENWEPGQDTQEESNCHCACGLLGHHTTSTALGSQRPLPGHRFLAHIQLTLEQCGFELCTSTHTQLFFPINMHSSLHVLPLPSDSLNEYSLCRI